MAELPVFRGWTVDIQLGQFRKMDPQWGQRFVDFNSRTGRQLRRDMRLVQEALMDAAEKLRERRGYWFNEYERAKLREVDSANHEYEILTRLQTRAETYAAGAQLVDALWERYTT